MARDGLGDTIFEWGSFGEYFGNDYRILLGSASYDASGNSLGNGVQKVETSPNIALAGSDSGEYVVAHEDYSILPGTDGHFEIQDDGFGASFHYSQTAGGQLLPSSGQFFAVPNGNYAFLYGTSVQMYDQTGKPIGSAIQLAGANPTSGSLGIDANGDLTLAWNDSANVAYVARFDPQGNMLGSPVTLSASSSSSPMVAEDAAGDFMVVYDAPSNGGAVAMAQFYDAATQTLGSAIQLSSAAASYAPVGVAADPAGDFVVVWGDQEGLAGAAIDGQMFDHQGIAIGSQFVASQPANSATSFSPLVSMDPSGSFSVGWTDSAGNLSLQLYRAGDTISAPASQAAAENTALVFSSPTNPITITDSDAGSGQVTLAVQPSTGTVSVSNVTGLSSVTGNGTGILSLTGTVDQLNAALNGLTYQPPSDSTENETMSMVLTDNNDTDGTPRTTTDSVSISVSPAAIYANGTPLTYIATSGPLAIGGVSVAGGVVDSAEVTIGTNFTSGEDSLGFQNQLGINGSYNSATGVLTLTGTASAADYQLALNSVTYSDSNPQPNLATRAISFQLSSGGVESPAVNRSIAVQSLSANSTLTVNGSSGQDTIEVIFSSPTAFAVIDNGATANYTTTTYQHIVIAGGTGDETIIYDDPYNPLTTDVSLGTAHGNSPNVFFVVSGATTLYIYANATSSTVLNAAAGNQFVVGVGSSTLNYSYLSDGVSHYSEVAYAADTVFLGQGGSNYAYLYSMSGASDLGDQTQSWMNAGSQVIVSSGFPQTYIVGAADGTDSVALDSDGSKFIGTPSFSYVTDDSTSGYSFLIGALYAKNVIAQAAGTTDTAFYYSGSGDTFTASASGDSSLTGDTSNFTSFKIQAIGYQALIAWSAGDGTDSAALSSTGGATFVGTGTYSTLAVGSNSIEVFGFAHVMADDANGGGDMATLYDSPGTNALTAQGSQAVLANSQVTLTVNNYANVSAVQQTGNDDTKHIGAIDFALSTLGNWTSD